MIGGVIQYANSMPSSNSNVSEVLLTPGEMESVFAGTGGGGGGGTPPPPPPVDSGPSCEIDWNACTKRGGQIGGTFSAGSNLYWSLSSKTTTEERTYTCIQGGVSVSVTRIVINGSIQGSIVNCTYKSTNSVSDSCVWIRYQQERIKYETGYVWLNKNGQVSSGFRSYNPSQYSEPKDDPSKPAQEINRVTNTGNPCSKPGV